MLWEYNDGGSKKVCRNKVKLLGKKVKACLTVYVRTR